MNKPLNVLIVEDSEDDAKLACQALRRGGFATTYRRVQTAADVRAALAGERWDAVISDFSMPGFNAMDALAIVRAADADIPFILVSGTIGEEIAVAAMKAGANDYMMKSSLTRLAPAIERELNEAQTRTINRHAGLELIEHETRFRQLAENIREVFILLDAIDNRVLYISPAYEETWGRSCESLYDNPQSWMEAIHPDDRAAVGEKYRKGVSAGTFEFEFRIVRHDGSIRCIEAKGFPVRDAAGKLTRIAGLFEDATERKQSEARIVQLNRVYAVSSGINSLCVRARDRDELFGEACHIAVDAGEFRMAWIGIVDRVTKKLELVASERAGEEHVSALRARFSSTDDTSLVGSLSARVIRDRKAVVASDLRTNPAVVFGETYAAAGITAVALLPLIVADEVVGVLALYAGESSSFHEREMKLLADLSGDISFAIDHLDKQERLDYLAYYDVLTGLANRSLFLDRVAQYIRSATSGGHKLAVLLIDLERFKNINDSLGRAAGDLLLRQVAEWLTRNAGDANLVARVGPDHFAVVLPDVARGNMARLLDETLDAFVANRFRLNDTEFRIGAKVGVALSPDDGVEADALLRNAEAALKKAKARGDRYLFYAQSMTDSVAGALTMENQLRRALDMNEFVLHYQPKINLATGKLTGCEALIRWNDPSTGLVPPGQFIPILEETGLIHEVGRWALRKAVEDYLGWRAAGLAPVRIAVNVSPLQLRDRGFISEIELAIAIDANAAEGLELEITESVVMGDVKRNIATLQGIRALGVTIAIDDFGTGFSSLSYLARLPVDTLKIDRSFIVDMTASPQGLALVSSIITLAHSLNLKVVAEGVETEEQSRLLHIRGCDEMQGYLFSKPVPKETFEARFLSPATVTQVAAA